MKQRIRKSDGEKTNKYLNQKVEYDGIKFDSKREMRRYVLLKEAEKNGIITRLEIHPKFELIPAVRETYTKTLKTKIKECERTLQLAITYTADFSYYKGDEYIVEDVKISPKMLPKEFVLKEKMMFALKNIKVKKVFSIKEPI